MSELPSSGFQACLRRGELLRDQGRYADAENYLQQAVGQEPNNADGYYELALCYCNWTGHAKKALEVIDRAISLDANSARSFALRAWILGNLDRHKETIAVANQALELNPNHILALNAQSRAYNRLYDWAQSEAHARRVLAINARNEVATNFLAIALRQQGRLQESEMVSASLLSHNPDNTMTQCNAGWTALQAGDYRRANWHFLEALRLDPQSDYARRGLLHAFNSRVWIYRLYFQFVAWISRHRRQMRILFFLAIYIGYRMVLVTLRTEFGSEGVRWGMVVVTLYLAVFGFGRSFGNLFLLLDRFARHALTGKEKAWSLLAGFIYGFFLTTLIAQGAWPQAAVLLAILGFFLWGVLAPRVQDAFARHSSDEGIVDQPGA
jgi:Tfp pilus assembly protein PilF